jgi:hypothetical protein
MESAEENIVGKYPKMASKLSYFKEVWAETFPNPERAVADRMAQRRKVAKM